MNAWSRARTETELRDRLVDRQLIARGVSDPLVLDAMRKVPRHQFVPDHLEYLAYDDGPLPIGSGQTISQPYIVALMTEALGLKGGESVLEIGTGSGYAAAVLGEIASEVYTIERIETLADHAAETLRSLGYDNVQVKCGDGTLGWPDAAPFDGIVVTAGGPAVPQALKDQLKIEGRLVIPVEDRSCGQTLTLLTRVSENQYTEDDFGGVRFVPLIGEQGWHPGKWPDSGDPALR